MQAFVDEQAFSRNQTVWMAVAKDARLDKAWATVGSLGGVGACHLLSWSTRGSRVSSATHAIVRPSPPLASPLG